VRAIRAPAAGEMSKRLEEQADSVHVKISLARALLHGHATIEQGPRRGRCHFQQHTPANCALNSARTFSSLMIINGCQYVKSLTCECHAVRCFAFALKGSGVKHVELDMELAVSVFLEVIPKYRNKEGTFLETSVLL